MVRTKDELLASIKSKFGDDTSDETITLLEDISDTLDTTKEGAEWKKKYEENDKMWRDKYTSRFFDNPPPAPTPAPTPSANDDDDKAEEIMIKDLFTESK